MFRKFSIEIERKVDTEALAWPESYMCEGDSGLGGNRGYMDLRRASWGDAARILAFENSLMMRLGTADDLTATLDTINDELYEDDEGLWGLDIGVASAVVALSAARCIPCTSCNGGCFGDHHHENYPIVSFYAKPAWVPYLLAAAEEAEVGLINDDRGSILVYADNISSMMLFASALIARRKKFAQLRTKSPRTSGS
jgi:hypothetical protein